MPIIVLALGASFGDVSHFHRLFPRRFAEVAVGRARCGGRAGAAVSATIARFGAAPSHAAVGDAPLSF
jgi:hypothetical protein